MSFTWNSTDILQLKNIFTQNILNERRRSSKNRENNKEIRFRKTKKDKKKLK